jgi:hypothetical protein
MANDGVDLVDDVDDDDVHDNADNDDGSDDNIVNYKGDNYYGDDVFNCCCCRGLQPCNNSCGGGWSQPCSCSILPGPEHHLQEGAPPFFLIKIKLSPSFSSYHRKRRSKHLFCRC